MVEQSETPENTPHGIPTWYDGTLYRSRGEARWAVYFDSIGWEWVYEPVDGDGYIPDFLIKGKSPFFIEVKSATQEAKYREPIPKIAAGVGQRWGHDILVVGADVVIHGDVAGILVDFLHGPDDWNTTYAEWVYCPECVGLRIAATNTGGHMRPCGHDAPKGGNSPSGHPQALWKLAGNPVQWKPAA